MTDQSLTATIERAFEDGSPINLETGEFPLILATQGEGTDGHILNVAGASAAERIPLQIDHSNSALGTLGSITNIRASRKGSLPVVKAIGRIELDGDGEQLAIRRDIANMIAKGHLSAVSVRARGTKILPRTELPANHPAFVHINEKNPVKRFGFFFERSTIEEGSIVALGADKRAIIGRSLDAPVSEFWTEFLGDDSEPVETEQYDFSQVTDIRSLEGFLRDVGASRSESKRIIALCKSSDSSPRDVERTQPKTDVSVHDVQGLLRDQISGLKTEIFQECSTLLRETLGHIN